jgi:hypothetical protein
MVARAYVDQLQRSNALTPAMVTDLTAGADAGRSTVAARRNDRALAGRLQSLAASLPAGGARRQLPAHAALRESLTAIAQRLR